MIQSPTKLIIINYSYPIKKMFNDFVHAVFGVFDPRPVEEKLDIATAD